MLQTIENLYTCFDDLSHRGLAIVTESSGKLLLYDEEVDLGFNFTDAPFFHFDEALQSLN